MHLHVCLATLPAVYRESVRDTLSLIGAGLSECGCRFTIDDSRAIFGGSAINLFVEHFETEAANSLIATKRAKGNDFPLGVVFTHSLADPNVMMGDFAWRAEGLRRVAEVADFVWYLVPGLTERADFIDPAKCFRFEVGYSERLATIPVQDHRDIDFFLPGFAYAHRRPVLAKLEALGYHVRCGDLTTPAYIHQSLMGRAKIILDMRRENDTPNLSPVRIAVAASNGLAIVSERFDPSALAELYAYTAACDLDDYAARCVELVEQDDPIAMGKTARDRFARERPLQSYVAGLLAASPFDPFRDGR